MTLRLVNIFLIAVLALVVFTGCGRSQDAVLDAAPPAESHHG